MVADVLIETLAPIRKRLLELNKEPQYLEQVLRNGGERATNIAYDCWHEVRDKVGLGNNALTNFNGKKDLEKIDNRLL